MGFRDPHAARGGDGEASQPGRDARGPAAAKDAGAAAAAPGRTRAALLVAVLPPAAATAVSLLLLHGLFRAVAAATAVFGFSAILRRRLGGTPAGPRRGRARAQP